ncbi:hypothetical protein TIFTF001_044747 [Ficus carica]|uniref:Uncharacterized protein n=1 Tax=Ficus carica TaxID=3494 RepID=A0AA87ZJ59_FICCA|nr:hypothetical protein TIFTF001_044747 [Ficus carica]
MGGSEEASSPSPESSTDPSNSDTPVGSLKTLGLRTPYIPPRPPRSSLVHPATAQFASWLVDHRFSPPRCDFCYSPLQGTVKQSPFPTAESRFWTSRSTIPPWPSSVAPLSLETS